jgi:hypothetical protein
MGLLQNIAVIAIILSKRAMLDVPSNWFVLSLAIADAFFCLAVIPLVNTILSASGFITFGVVAQFITIASAGNLLMLTFNRFLSVYNSLRYPLLMTCSRAKRLVIIPWTIAFLLSAVVGILLQVGIQDILYLHSSYYTILIISISALNIYMIRQARSKREATVRLQSAVLTPNEKLLKKEYRLFIRLLIVTLTFFGACIPTMVLMYLYPTVSSRQTRSFVRKSIWCLFALLFNAAANPVIYAFNHPIFERYFNRKRNVVFPQQVESRDARTCRGQEGIAMGEGRGTFRF